MRKVEQPDEAAPTIARASVLQGKVANFREITLTHREADRHRGIQVSSAAPQAMAVKTPAITANATGGDHHHPPPSASNV